MPRVSFTQNLQRHLSAPPRRVEGATVREALDRVFAENPRLRGYVLDDQGRLRKHPSYFALKELVEGGLVAPDGG